MATLEEKRWDAMDSTARHDWLISAGEHNVTFKYLDWQELPEPLAERLMKVLQRDE